jgi:hypothetical protein
MDEPAFSRLLAQSLGELARGVGDDQVAVRGIARFDRPLRGDCGKARDPLGAVQLSLGTRLVDFLAYSSAIAARRSRRVPGSCSP